MANPQLNPRQQRFVQEYLIDLNATQAAIRAGYSARTAQQTGSENLSKPVIAAAIEEAQAARSERTMVTQDDVVAGLHREATWMGDGSTHGARVQAWAQLGRHLGMFADKHDHSGKVVIEFIDATNREAVTERRARRAFMGEYGEQSSHLRGPSGAGKKK